jgi:hypothetical protein
MRVVLLAIVLASAPSCGPIRSSTIGLSSMREERHATFLVDGATIIVRTEDPMGLVVVIFDPSIDEGRVVLNAGMTSSGGPGPHVQCVDVASLAPPTDWADRLAWREPDGTLVPITEIERGDTAHALAVRCRS